MKIVDDKGFITPKQLEKISNQFNIEIVNYDTFYKELPEDQKSSAPPKGRIPIFALLNPVTKRPRIVPQVKEIDYRMLHHVYDMIKHEFVHVKQAAKNKAGYKLPNPKNRAKYLSDKNEIMAYAQSISDILVKYEHCKNIKEAIKKLGNLDMYRDIRGLVSKEVLKRYHKYIYLYLQQAFESKETINEDMMKFPQDDDLPKINDKHIRPNPEIQQKLSHKGDKNATPYSDIDLFQKGDLNHSTQERIASQEFEQIMNKVKEVGHLAPNEFDEILKMISQIEKKHKSKLENLAKKIIQKELGLSQDIMDNIVARLLTHESGEENPIKDFEVDPKTGKVKTQKQEPPKQEDDKEEDEEKEDENNPQEENNDEEKEKEAYNDQEQRIDDGGKTPLDKLGLTKEEVNQLVGEIQVRKIMNSMIMGGGYKLFDVLSDFKGELDAIDRRLYRLYTVLNPNGNLLQWIMPPTNIGIRKVAGSVKLKFDDGNEQNLHENEDNGKKGVPRIIKVEAVATNFAVLLHEIAKGALEYIFSLRLSKLSKNLRRAVVAAADDYAAETFHKLLGPQIWKQFFYGIEIALEQYVDKNELYGLDNNREMLPLVINRITTMKTQAFIDLVDDMLNPGEAQKNRREEPLERLKKIIHGINMEIKEFMDSQDGEGGEIDLGEPNPNIDHAINTNKDEWINDLEGKINQQEEPEPEQHQTQKDYSKMDKNQLSLELANALEHENYELAAILRNAINKK